LGKMRDGIKGKKGRGISQEPARRKAYLSSDAGGGVGVGGGAVTGVVTRGRIDSHERGTLNGGGGFGFEKKGRRGVERT